MIVSVVDDDGGVSSDQLQLTVLLTLPLTLQLAPESDSGLKGDQLTSVSFVKLMGTTLPERDVELDVNGDGSVDAVTTSDMTGDFVFSQVLLEAGDNRLVARVEARNRTDRDARP